LPEQLLVGRERQKGVEQLGLARAEPAGLVVGGRDAFGGRVEGRELVARDNDGLGANSLIAAG
jgi:hypothetical protein